MKLLPVDHYQRQYSPTYRSKETPVKRILNSHFLTEQIRQINSASPETQKLFKNLTALATSFMAGLAIYSEKNDELKTLTNKLMQYIGLDNADSLIEIINATTSEKTNKNDKPIDYKFDLESLYAENSDREKYLMITSKYFPNLNNKYIELLHKSQTEPENINNKKTLDTLEIIFDVLVNNDGLKYRKRYFEALDTDYINCLENVCENFRSTLLNGNSPMQYLVLLHNGTIDEKTINTWTKAKNLDNYEIMYLRDFDEQALINLSNLKEVNQDFKISYAQPIENTKSKFKLNVIKIKFKDNLPAKDKLKIVSKVHEALYGPIYFQETTSIKDEYIEKDIQTEMMDCILKDNQMDAVYNLAKYIEPDAFKNFQLTANEVKFLTPDNPTYKKLKELCGKIFINLDFQNPRIKTLVEVVCNNDNFGDIFVSRHAKFRFLSRFILKDNPNPDLKKETAEKIQILLKELNKNANQCFYYCFLHDRGTAPQFYIKDSQLGNYVKVTLNQNGTIHTIYEDLNRERKNKELLNNQSE